MTNYKLHEDCKQLSWTVYQDEKPKNINGWKYKKSIQNSNGFYAEVYEKDGKAIFAIRGTDTARGNKEKTKDLYSDAQMGLAHLPYQIKSAEKAYTNLIQQYGKENIITTGHSLGGSQGVILGTKYGGETVTFGAYGVKYITGLEINHTDNITNYGNAQDGVFVMNIDSQIGKTIVLNSDGEGNALHKGYKIRTNAEPHKLENFGDLSKGVEYKKEEFDNTDTPLFKTGVEYLDYDDSVFDLKNRVLYKGEINPLDLDKDSHLYDLYMEQWIDKSPMPTKAEVDKRTRIGELIYVEEYTRSDGTKVSGYYRACPR